MIETRMPVAEYTRSLTRELDGKAWVAVSIASLVALLDVFVGAQLIPIREKTDFGKAVTLLAFTPVLSFLVTTTLRELPFESQKFSVWIRVAACLGTLLALNF